MFSLFLKWAFRMAFLKSGSFFFLFFLKVHLYFCIQPSSVFLFSLKKEFLIVGNINERHLNVSHFRNDQSQKQELRIFRGYRCKKGNSSHDIQADLILETNFKGIALMAVPDLGVDFCYKISPDSRYCVVSVLIDYRLIRLIRWVTFLVFICSVGRKWRIFATFFVYVLIIYLIVRQLFKTFVCNYTNDLFAGFFLVNVNLFFFFLFSENYKEMSSLQKDHSFFKFNPRVFISYNYLQLI